MFCTNCGVALYEGAAFCAACGQPVSAGTTPGVPQKVAYAGFWLRAVAFVIDALALTIVTLPIFLLVVVLFGLELPPPEAMQPGALPPMRFFIPMEATFVTVNWLYCALMESSAWQGTLGKRALKIGVTDTHGKRISFGRASGRFFGKIVSGTIFFIGYTMAAFTAKQQALHDIFADCLVVKMP